MKEADTKDVGKHYFQTKTSVEENDVREMLTRLYNLEFMKTGPTDRKLETSMSREDHKFITVLQEGTKLRNGHYQVPFPFKHPCVNFPNNRHQKRFSYLEKNTAKMTYSERITSGLRRIYSCKGLCQEMPLERLGTNPIIVSTIQTSLER